MAHWPDPDLGRSWGCPRLPQSSCGPSRATPGPTCRFFLTLCDMRYALGDTGIRQCALTRRNAFRAYPPALGR